MVLSAKMIFPVPKYQASKYGIVYSIVYQGEATKTSSHKLRHWLILNIKNNNRKRQLAIIIMLNEVHHIKCFKEYIDA